MAIVFYYGLGSPFAWRVWLALEHKKLPYELRVMSFEAGKDFLVGAVGAADFTVYPFFALAMRTQKRLPSLGLDATFGPQLTAWMRRVEALPYFEKTIPPHWRT